MGWDENSQFGEGAAWMRGNPLKKKKHHIFLRQFWVYMLRYFSSENTLKLDLVDHPFS